MYMENEYIIEMLNITKEFPGIKANDNITLQLKKGEIHALLGENGAGKSTLMNILGCLDRPTSGHYYIAGEDVAKFNAAERATLRNKRIGFVFQNFNLLSRTTALENVMMPAVYAHPALSMKAMRERSVELLNLVGLSDRMDHTPAQLSGGQQQRVAIARSLINNPSILLANGKPGLHHLQGSAAHVQGPEPPTGNHSHPGDARPQNSRLHGQGHQHGGRPYLRRDFRYA